MQYTSSNLEKYRSANPVKRFLLEKFLNKISEIVTDINPNNILDVGCGEGLVLKQISKLVEADRLCGVDVSSEALEVAKKNVPNASFEVMSIYDLQFDDNEFDLVISLEVLEHLEDPAKALEELNRVGSNNFVLSVPNEPLFSILSFLSGKYLNRFGKHPEHINFWGTNEFQDFVSKKLNVRNVHKVTPWTIVTANS